MVNGLRRWYAKRHQCEVQLSANYTCIRAGLTRMRRAAIKGLGLHIQSWCWQPYGLGERNDTGFRYVTGRRLPNLRTLSGSAQRAVGRYHAPSLTSMVQTAHAGQQLALHLHLQQ